MTPPDALLADREVRDAIHALELAPLDVPFAVIDSQADQLRTRARWKLVGAVAAAAVVVVVLAVVGALSVAQAHRSVRVDDHTKHGRRTHVSSPTTAHAATTSTMPHHVGTALPPPVVNAWAPTPTTAPAARPARHLSAPTTAAPTPASTTPTTSAHPNTDLPPLEPGRARLTIVLDDTGLHAPATFSLNGGDWELLFLDRRAHAHQPSFAYLRDESYEFVIERWESPATPAEPTVSPGQHVLQASDSGSDIPGATVTVTFTP